MPRQHQGQRTGKKAFEQRFSPAGNAPGDLIKQVQAANVHNQRIIGGSAFRPKNTPDRDRGHSMRAQPVDGLGRERHHLPLQQAGRRDGWRAGQPRLHEARFTIQAEKPSRKRIKPGKCSSGKLYFAGASSNTL
jgi:hypothetical protein